MKKIFQLAFSAIVLLVACNKENPTVSSTENDSIEVKTEFVKILSKAVSNSEDVRAFIKSQALQKFDKDYDVFYPFVKDLEVAEGVTFRQCLLAYTTESTLSRIEDKLPLLNISVPAWEWLGGFDVNSWDTSDSDIVVGYEDGKSTHSIYQDGELVDEVESDLLPTFPTIIVKNNERMKLVSPATKAEAYTYDFSDDAFRPTNTKVTPTVSYVYLTTTPGSNYVDTASFASLCPEAVTAWNEYGDDTYSAQRSYIYFGLRKGETIGVLNPKIRESVLAIRLNTTTCIDDDDPTVSSVTKKNSDYSSESALLDALWSDGQFEIKLYATTIDSTGSMKVLNENVIPVSGQEIFDLSVVKRTFYHKTTVSARKYVYKPSVDDLQPKWYYLPTPLKFNSWNPVKESTIFNIHAYEVDGTTEKTVTETIKKQNGITITGNVGSYGTININTGSKTDDSTITYTIKEGSDDLGSYEVHFDDYVIRSESNGQYELAYYSTAQLDFILVPLK